MRALVLRVLLVAGLLFLPAVLLALPQGEYQLDVAMTMLLYVALALGLNVTVGLAGLLDLGYIAFFGLGAYATAILMHGGPAQAEASWGWSYWMAVPAAVAVAGLAGLVIGLPTLRLRGDYLAIVTLAFGQIAKLTENNWDALTNGPQGMEVGKPILFGLELRAGWQLYYILLLFVLLVWWSVRNLNKSAIGRAWVAIREDEIAAASTGVNVPRVKLLAFVTGAAIAGLVGSFFAVKQGFVSPPSFDFIETVTILAMVVLGGIGSLPGVILGAGLLAALPELLRSLPGLLGLEGQFDVTPYRMLLYGAAMVLMMAWRPEGLLPDAHRRAELHPEDPSALPDKTEEVRA
ncbi:MAG: hypothetical protein VKO64_03555 [Candidatus Sericytochromatia bacterium]|nr:hypothetical protein [Candidatus Sericytochromatia bacterium]